MVQRSFVRVMCCLVLVSAFCTPGLLFAGKEPRKGNEILILHSYHPGFPWTDAMMKGMQDVLSNASAPTFSHVEYLDTKRQPDPEYFTHVLDAILHYKLDGRQFDLVLVSDREALKFVLGHRNDLFKSTPVVYCGIESNLLVPERADPLLYGVIENPDYTGLLQTILSLQPETSEVVVIGNRRDQSGRSEGDMFKSAVSIFQERLAFTYWDDLQADELATRLRGLKKGQVVFINGQVVDSSGRLLTSNARNGILRESSPVALYGACDLCMGHGIVGGHLLSPYVLGTGAANLALEILSGEDAQHGHIVVPERQRPVFDYLQLKKFGIAETLLPQNAILVNSPSRFSNLSKRTIGAIVASFVLALGVILFLINNLLLRRKAEAKTLESKKQYKALSQQFQIILDGIPESLTLISREMKVIWSNKGAGTNQLNTRLGSATGESCCEMLYNRKDICVNCPATLAFETGTARESAITTPDNRVLEVRAFPLRDEENTVTSVIMMASDITEKNRLREEAIRSSRMASLGELAAGVAHEINNPNALILLNADLVQKSCIAAAPILKEHYERAGDFKLGSLSYTEMSQELPYLFKEMLDSASRIKDIVHDLKDFARNDSSVSKESVDLNDAVQAAVRLVSSTIKKSTDNFQAYYGKDMPNICGNFQRIEQIVINLIVNACESLTSKKASVQLSTYYDEERELTCLLVRDDGVGIKPEIMSHITDPFFTTKREHGGTGLGLSVTSRIVQDHNGKLDFESAEGAGTTVTLALPVLEQ